MWANAHVVTKTPHHERRNNVRPPLLGATAPPFFLPTHTKNSLLPPEGDTHSACPDTFHLPSVGHTLTHSIVHTHTHSHLPSVGHTHTATHTHTHTHTPTHTATHTRTRTPTRHNSHRHREPGSEKNRFSGHPLLANKFITKHTSTKWYTRKMK